MKSDLLHHRGYYGSVNFSADDNCLVGKVEFIEDLILYEASDIDGLRAEFEQAIDDYLERCAAAGHEPNVSCKGSFSVRVGPELHKEAVLAASRNKQSLNEFVKDAITLHLRDDEEQSASGYRVALTATTGRRFAQEVELALKTIAWSESSPAPQSPLQLIGIPWEKRTH